MTITLNAGVDEASSSRGARPSGSVAMAFTLHEIPAREFRARTPSLPRSTFSAERLEYFFPLNAFWRELFSVSGHRLGKMTLLANRL